MSADIIARLTVDPSNFVTGINSAYAAVAANAKVSTGELGNSFNSTIKAMEGSARRSFGELSRELRSLATDAAVRGPTSGGIFNFDTNAAKAAASASRDRATALQQFVTAAERASVAEGHLAAETRLYMVAGQAELQQEVKRANELERHAAALDHLTTAMGHTEKGQGRVTVSSGQMRVGMQQLGYQVSDISQQLGQKGVAAMTIFSQQAPQVIQALSLMTNRTSGFLGAMAGWPGIIGIAAITLGTTLYNALTTESTALVKATQDANDHADSLEGVARSAHNALLSINQLAAAEAEKAYSQSYNEGFKAEQIAGQISAERAKLTSAQHQFEMSMRNPGTHADSLSLLYSDKIDAAQSEIKRLEGELAIQRRSASGAEANYRAQRTAATRTEALSQSTKSGAAQARYDDQLGILNQNYEAIKRPTAKETETYKASVIANRRALDLETEQINDDRKARKKSGPTGRSAIPSGRVSSGSISRDALHAAVLGQESGGDPNAISPVGARGLMQTMPGTLRDPGFGIRPAQNNSSAEMKRVGDDYLDTLMRRYGGNVTMALMAYNWGPGRVDQLIKGVGDPRKGQITEKAFLAHAPQETRNYVPSVLSRANGLARDGRNLSAIDAVDNKRNRALEEADRAAQAYADGLARADNEIASILSRYDEQPRFLDQADGDIRKLEEIARQYDAIGTASAKVEAEKARSAAKQVEAGKQRPFQEIMAEGERQLAMGRLVLDGKAQEAQIQQRIFQFSERYGALQPGQEAGIRSQYGLMQAQTRELELQAEHQQHQLDLVNQAQDNIKQTTYDLLKGRQFSAIGGFFKRQFDTYLQGLTDQLNETVLGDTFRKQRDKITGMDQVDAAATGMSGSINNTAIPAIESLAEAAWSASERIFGRSSSRNSDIYSAVSVAFGSSGANDNQSAAVDEIIVSAHRQALSIGDEFKKGQRELFKGISSGLFGDKIADSIGKAAEAGFHGFAFGTLAGSAFGKTGGAIGGGIGALLEIGTSLSKNKSSGLGKLLSGASAALPQAAIALQLSSAVSRLLGNDSVKGGKILGPIAPFLTAIFGKAKTGSATLGFNNGTLGLGAVGGNSSGQRGLASGGIDALAAMLSGIADDIGGSISGSGSVSIGLRKNKYIVDPTGKGRTKGAGTLSFDTEKEAIAAALKDALSDGVITGISAASQKILNSGQDLQKAIQKVVVIEGIPKALKARMDPVGAALDTFNSKWDKTIAALKEGGATALQLADAEKLYRLERADVMSAANDNLKEFINGLNFGANSTYSLIDQEKSARANVAPYLAAIKAGDFAAVDQQKYLAGANDYLGISRQLGGSGPEWFAAVEEFKGATQKLADGLAAGSTSSSARDPFAELTANSTKAAAEILALQSGQLANIEATLAKIAANGGFGGLSSFIGADRSFLASAA